MCVCFLNWNSVLLAGRKIACKIMPNSPIDHGPRNDADGKRDASVLTGWLFSNR